MDSPFIPHLHTNHIPSDYELQQIKQYLVDPTEKMMALDSEITRVQTILDALCSERDELHDHISAYRALISPVRRLPHDILREVFVACLPSDRNAVMSVQEAPILLGRVCSTWRNIFLSTPRLWSSIHIPIPSIAINDVRTQRRCEAVKAWLAKSGTCPLSISLHHNSTYPTFNGAPYVLHPIIDVIWGVSSRWKHIRISMPTRMLSHLSTLHKSDTPLLESLQLSTVCYQWGDVFDRKHSLHILEASRLNSFTTDLMDRDLFNVAPISWSNLTELNLDFQENHDGGLTIDEALNLAHRCPNLVTCRFSIFAPDESNQSTRYTATLPHLRSMSVIEGSGVDATEFFNCLVLPSLQNVVYRTYNASTERPLSLMTLLSRSTHIETITFNWPTPTRVHLLDCLHLLPHIIRMHVNMDGFQWAGSSPFSTFDDACLQLFLPAPENDILSCLCPRLESLDCFNVSFSDAMLLKFLNYRTSIVFPEIAQLKRMHAGFDHPPEGDLEDEIIRLRSGGLDISLSYDPGPPSPYENLSPWSGLPVVDLQDDMRW